MCAQPTRPPRAQMSSSSSVQTDLRSDTTSSTAGMSASASSASLVATKPARKPWTVLRVLNRVWKAIKYTYSCALLGITLGVCFYNIGLNTSSFFPGVPLWVNYILFVVFTFLLAVLEGTMISLSQLRRVSAASYAKTHPAAYRNTELAFRPDYLEKFLMGRQANVIVLVFMLSRLLSTPSSVTEVGTLGGWIISGFLQTGLFGAFIVLIIGNLVPQVTAAKFPVQFINFTAINVLIRWCLFIRWIGLPHACWLCAKSIAFVLGLDWNAPLLGDAPKTVGTPTSSTPSSALTPSTEGSSAPSPQDETAGIVATGDDKVYADDYDGFMAKHALSTSVRALKAELPAGVRKALTTPEGARDSLHWASPERVSEVFTTGSLSTPDFLRPPTSAAHVPAHIVAFQLAAEHQRLLRELEAAKVDLRSAEAKAVTTPLYTSLKTVVDAAALERLQVLEE
eukprot:Unigene3935_Nuclearia_a/m.11983 Unigene3935_Nuclearia_a/g.11983  ORF Unigene3935_Nuclearia_a/g.11983 Unigene3935_Nuclearia_a/m.11983 type:complete len:453 (+) Unigene3935_Nuclearia_a:82-1440(+)